MGHFIQQYIYGPLDPYGHLMWDNLMWFCPAIAYSFYFRRWRPARGPEAIVD